MKNIEIMKIFKTSSPHGYSFEARNYVDNKEFEVMFFKPGGLISSPIHVTALVCPVELIDHCLNLYKQLTA